MKNKSYLLLLFFIPFASINAGSKEAVDYLMLNSQSIMSALNNCKETKTYSCWFPEKDSILKLFQKNKATLSRQEMAVLVQLYLKHIWVFSEFISGTPILIDDINIGFLERLICKISTAEDSSFSQQAYYKLMANTGFTALKAHRISLMSALNACPGGKSYLEAMLSAGDTAACRILLERGGFDQSYRAMLGDTAALTGLIDRYRAAKVFYDKLTQLKCLLRSNTRQGIEEAIRTFNTPIYGTELRTAAPPCTSTTLRYATLLYLQRQYPTEPLFGEDLVRVTLLKDSKDPDSVRAYITRFTAWAKRTYGVTPTDPIGAAVIHKSCR